MIVCTSPQCQTAAGCVCQRLLQPGFSTVSSERIAETLHEHNRIQQTAQCLAALHQVPKDRPEFMHWKDLPEDYRGYVRAIAESIKYALDHPDTPVLQVVLRKTGT